MDFNIDVELRNDFGKGASRRLRSQGRIPAIVYMHGIESVPTSVDALAFTLMAKQAKISQVFTLKSKDQNLKDRSVLVKEIQREHVKGGLLHIDFQLLRDDEEVNLRIPLIVVGEAPGVKVDGGILTIAAHDLSVHCLPKAIPQSIEVDVSGLNMGQSIHAQDLKLPSGVRLHGNPLETIASVVAVRVVEEAPAATPAEGAAVEGQAAAAGAEGAAATPAAEAGDKADKAGKPAAEKKEKK